ncbi:MAG: molecular chaperone [Campylobacterales bacterium]
MNDSARKNLYALLSRLFSKELDDQAVAELKSQSELLENIGEKSAAWFANTPEKTLLDALNVDFTSLFLLYTPPIEAAMRDNSKEIPVGLENPVMQFYRRHGFHINMNLTHLNAPDHLAIELGFMEALIGTEEREAQQAFLADHLLQWAPSFLLAQGDAADTPFYQELCEFAAEFLLADYQHLSEAASAAV